ncbi:MAG: FAD-dependent oxidoreductase [Candidatus Glassbacteria bacterium]
MKKPGRNKYPNLFQQAKLGSLTVPNRIKYAACSVSNFNNRDGTMTEREYARMQVVAATGAGIITNQGAYPDARGEGKAYYRQLAIYDDKFIPQYRRIADLIHKHGAIAIQQILHAGRYGGIDLDYCIQSSDVKQTLKHFRPPRKMTKEQIKKCIEDHVQATRRSLEAGFDGVEVTSFMGYLLSNFLSKFTNTRTDEYGGSLVNRGRFMRELIRAMKKVLGSKPMIIRLNGLELMDEYGGSTHEECLEYMKMAEDSGADCISIVIGWHESRKGALGRDVATDEWLFVSERAKEKVKIPVAFGPRFGDPVLAEKALSEGKLDFWEVCRPMLADPELIHKVEEDRLEEIKPCTGGLVCLARMFRNLPYICTVNPRLGHEAEPSYDPAPAANKKRVFVIGGGPAGLECAVTAARRGHDVTIYEKESRLGGQLIYASREPSGGNKFLDLIKYYEIQIEKLGITVELNTEMTARSASSLEPDVAVIATGAKLAPNPFPTLPDAKFVSAYDVIGDRVELGKRVLVVMGERLGLVAAEYAASKGCEVTLIEEGRSVGSDVAPTFRWRHTAWLREYNIRLFSGAEIVKIESRAVNLLDKNGVEKNLEADTLILGGPRKSRNILAAEMEYAVDELYVVGDAVLPRSLSNAIHEGYRIGVRI